MGLTSTVPITGRVAGDSSDAEALKLVLDNLARGAQRALTVTSAGSRLRDLRAGSRSAYVVCWKAWSSAFLASTLSVVPEDASERELDQLGNLVLGWERAASDRSSCEQPA